MQERRKAVQKNEDQIRAYELKYPNPEDDPDHNIMQVKFEKHLVYHDYLLGEPIDRVKAADLTPKKFYSKYLSKSRPVLIEDGCADWLGMVSWNKPIYEQLLSEGINATTYQIPDLRPEERKHQHHHHHAHDDKESESDSESSDEEDAHWDRERYHPTYLQKIGFEQSQMNLYGDTI